MKTILCHYNQEQQDAALRLYRNPAARSEE